MATAAAPAEASRSRGFRNPTVLNGIALVIVVLLVATIALPASQTPPPAIAELAPQAQQQILDAPPNQQSDSGLGPGGSGGPGEPTTTTTTTPPAGPGATTTIPGRVDRAAVRRCVGNPPRQTEDPQSPPCVNYFEGDNGGETWKGVTRNEIRVAVPANTGVAKELFAYFNSRYEFYGRKLVAVDIGGAPGDVQGMISQAVKADKEKQVFASTLYGDASGREYVYYDELAKRGIVSANARPSQADEAHLAQLHPHEWSYLPTFDTMTRNEAEWICKAVKGGAPQFAGGAERAASTRKYALVTTVSEDGTGPDNGPWRSIIKGCGIDLQGRDYQFVKKEPTDDQAGIAQAQDLVLKLQTDGVTTVICHCHTQTAGFYMSTVATKQGYFPEWIVGTYMYVAEDSHVQFTDGQQAEHSFGIGWWDKELPPEQSPWFWAVKDGDPNKEFGSAFDYYDARWLFNSMRILAAGIQMAGPKLTPTSFADGLRKSIFPNPSAGRPPQWQAGVSLQGKHSFVDDGALVWLSKEEPSAWGNVPGAVCYAKRGIRYRLGSWPSDSAGLFQLPCY
jgi:hypothetical protein